MGYRTALEQYQIPYREELVCYMDEKRDTYSYQSGYRLMQELLKRETFTAVYATADTLAIGACRALKEAGISVPEECSVAGFDGMDAGRFLYSESYNDPSAGGRDREGNGRTFI